MSDGYTRSELEMLRTHLFGPRNEDQPFVDAEPEPLPEEEEPPPKPPASLYNLTADLFGHQPQR